MLIRFEHFDLVHEGHLLLLLLFKLPEHLVKSERVLEVEFDFGVSEHVR